jgi:Family of unknown function (DUF6152)
MVRMIAAVAPIVLLASTAAHAHHSFAVHFVADVTVEIEGVVTGFSFRNPHGLLGVDVAADDGSVEHWRVETNSPNILRRRGWSESSVHAGDRVTIEGYPARDGSTSMRVFRIAFPDGRMLIGQRPSADVANGAD